MPILFANINVSSSNNSHEANDNIWSNGVMISSSRILKANDGVSSFIFLLEANSTGFLISSSK